MQPSYSDLVNLLQVAHERISAANLCRLKKQGQFATSDIAHAIEASRKTPKASADKVGTLFDAIKHGDEKHQAWLKSAIDSHLGSSSGTSASLLSSLKEFVAYFGDDDPEGEEGEMTSRAKKAISFAERE